jgi:hypothetical protein
MGLELLQNPRSLELQYVSLLPRRVEVWFTYLNHRMVQKTQLALRLQRSYSTPAPSLLRVIHSVNRRHLGI